MKTKSYSLTTEQQVEVDKAVAAGRQKYKDIAHIICEQPLTDEQVAVFDEELEDDNA